MLGKLKKFFLPEIEEKILKFWKENQIFEKSLKQRKGKKSFIFFEGPPTANGRPGIHHVLSRVFKDLILRFKTMAGYFALRRAGWDTHGLPVEIEIEKELGIKTKPEIEKFGIANFNDRAKTSVWRYKDEWEKLTERIGFWLNFKDCYITYDNRYIETLWWIFGQIAKRNLLKKFYKIVPFCPRCQTALSTHELGQPGAYRKTKDPSIYIKFEIRNPKPETNLKSKKTKPKEYLLVWTTTPWTLPANLAIAVNPALTYTKFKVGDEYFWSYNPPPSLAEASYGGQVRQAREGEHPKIEVAEKISGKKLIGLEYEPLYNVRGSGFGVRDGRLDQAERSKKRSDQTPDFYRVLAADFIETEQGTGLVHIAPTFGEDDFNLMKDMIEIEKIPVTIDDRGVMKEGFPGAGKFVKEADKDIIDDLTRRNLLYRQEIIEHDYPFCWRCSSPLLYFIRFSWFIEMGKLRKDLLAANRKINWIPEHIKEGRFGEWLREVKDWAVSRERYWGTPLPIWECGKGHHLVVGRLDDLNKHACFKNIFYVIRHAEATHNIDGIIASGSEQGKKNISHLTPKGFMQAKKLAQEFKKKKIDLIFCSPYKRTKETAEIIAKATAAKIILDKRISEIDTGIFNNRLISEHKKFFANPLEEFTKTPPGGENLNDVKKRMFAFLRDINSQYRDKNILIISHGDPLWVVEGATRGLSDEEILKMSYIQVGEIRQIYLNNWPYNDNAKIDFHRPFVDEIYLKCPKCGEQMKRIKELADVWFDSGAMPFAQWHYPFENKNLIDPSASSGQARQFPADYIAEGIDQTRGWFYTLLAVSVLLKRGAPYRNVVSLGLVLDKNGQKMSKTKGNAADPWLMCDKYGADALRWYFFTINPPGESKCFDENDLAKTLRKFILLIYNSFAFYDLYANKACVDSRKNLRNSAFSVLDRWIIARLHQTIDQVTENLNRYAICESGRFIEVFVDDLSRWYIRRSRRRFQRPDNKEDWERASATLGNVLLGLSKLIAPFTPFFAEALYESIKYQASSIKHKESIHLEDWPKADKKLIDEKLLETMAEIRRLASLALAKRAEAGIKVRQPLQKLKVSAKGGSVLCGKSNKLKVKEELLNILKDEVNVKEVVFSAEGESLPTGQAGAPGGDDKLKEEIELDTKITPELKREGIIRELMRLVQDLRQDAGYRPKDRVALMVEFPSELKNIFEAGLAEFKKETNIKDIQFKKVSKFDIDLSSQLENWPIWMALKKIKG